MTDNNWKFSAYFKLYGKDGLQVSFTVNGDDGATHIAEFGDYLSALLGEEGFSLTPESIKPGEKLQEVDGWVLGETSNGQRCLHLFKNPLQWKVATVYEENIASLPINITNKTFQWPGAAPEREAAERRNAINPCNFTVVLVPTGKTSDKGNPVLKFDRVVGFTPAGGAKNTSSKASDVQSYADLYSLLKDDARKFADWCRDKQKSEQNLATPQQIDVLCEEIDNITGDKGTGQIVMEVLTGIPAAELSGELKSYVTNGVTKWIAPFIMRGKMTVENPDRRMTMVEVIKFIWGMANGYNEVNTQAAKSSTVTRGRGYDRMDESPATDEDIPF